MVHYIFYYFPIRGRGEPIRQLFKLAGEHFEEVNYGPDDWPQHKGEMPLGQMPVLEVDGVKIAQSTAILRYLGHQFHRAGATPIECARLDMIGDTIQEMTNNPALAAYGAVLRGVTPCDDKVAYFKEHVQPVIDEKAPLIEKFLLDNGNNGLFVGDKITWVDVFGAEMLCRFIDFGLKDSLDAFPHIKGLINRVHNDPNIKRHIDTRPFAPI